METIPSLERTEFQRQPLVAALLRAEDTGLDIERAIANEYGEPAGSSDNTDRQADILAAALEIAEGSQLKPAFFESTPKTVLLMGLAAAWVDLDRRKQQRPTCRQRLSQEAGLLANLSILLAGNDSAMRRPILAAAPWHRELFGSSKMQRELGSACDAFLEGVSNPALAARVSEVLQADGPGSLLYNQRQAFGLTAEIEQPFMARVLNMATRAELRDSGAQNAFGEDVTTNDGFVDRLERNLAEYNERFSTRVAPYNADAFVYTPPETGIPVLTMYAPTAYSLLSFAKHGPTTPYQGAQVTIVRHEYGHTQKQFDLGRLGHTFEELKAQYPTGSKTAYWDSQEFFEAMSMVTGADLRQLMLDSLPEPDAATAFTTRLANSVGLRNTLLMAASHPVVYSEMGMVAKYAAAMPCFREPQDRSLYDSLLREADVRRDDTVRAAMLGEWITLLSKFEPDAQGVINIQRMRAENPHSAVTYMARQKVKAARHFGM